MPWPPFYDSLTLMFQREVARRIVASPENPDEYGRLGILANWRCTTKILFDLPPAAFTPPPKVTSSVVHLVPRQTPVELPLEALERVTGADGIERCAIHLDAAIHRTEPAPRRPFQGWRYLKPEETPRDLPQGRAREDTLPPDLAQALAEIGLR